MRRIRPTLTTMETPAINQVGVGFFFFGFALFGSATGSDPRSIDVRRPLVKV